jgi:alkanesulfonate monooxygenase SsuD/methylene tetrahydromethanopterin reductase-like flavin-dependent oxidoreductase (luciferase family)
MTSTASGAVKFGLFDWIDFSDPSDLAGRYEGRLQMLEVADRAGFFCYHLAEHHLTTLGGTPSPGVFLAAAAQRTSRIHLGPLVYILPLYDPIRLAEEVCMLDHLSRGRLELGTGRGVSPLELASQNVGPEELRDVYQERFELLIEALKTGGVGPHKGRRPVPERFDIVLRPLQQPYPPLWYPYGSNDTARWLGEQGISTVTQSQDLDSVRGSFDIYREVWETNRHDPDRLNAHEPSPKLGILRQVYVADSAEMAMREGKAAFEHHRESFLYLWEKHGIAERWYGLKDFEANTAQGGMLFGTPEEVRERVEEQIDRTGANYFIANFSFGDLTNAQVLGSLGKFAEHVMPAIPDRSPAGA